MAFRNAANRSECPDNRSTMWPVLTLAAKLIIYSNKVIKRQFVVQLDQNLLVECPETSN